ncbi:MAG: hypothetical protein ACODAQ_04965 [Phycisphaeraceae bacterium]
MSNPPSNERWITDLGGALPEDAADHVPRPGRWTVMSYETAAASGRLAMALPDSDAPSFTIPLRAVGTYRIELGLVFDHCDQLLAKLAGERAFDRLTHAPVAVKHAIESVPWRTVTLTGDESLVLAQQRGRRAAVAWVALIPETVTDPPRGASRYLVHVTDDGLPGNWGPPIDDENHVWMIEPMARTGVNMISRGIDLGGTANYATRLDHLRADTHHMLDEVMSRPVDRDTVEILHDHIQRGFCAPKRYFELAREHGMQVFGYHRMAKIHALPPYHHIRSHLYDQRPDLRCVDVTGAAVNRLSMAHEEVRAEFIDLLRESIDLGATGVNNVFARGLPVVLHEAPVRELIQQRHDVDPWTLNDDDPRAVAARTAFVTQYMREQRAALDVRPDGERPRIIATVPATREICGFFGLDPEAWAREGLIDVLCPYRWGWDAADTPLEMDYFAEAVRGSTVQLLPVINTWRGRDPAALIERALELTAWPVDGFTVWDRFFSGPVFREAIASLHDPEVMRDTLRRLRAGRRTFTFQSLAGTAEAKYPYGWAM